MTYALAYVATALTFLVLDFIWLGYVAKPLYQQEIGPLLLEKFNVAAAVGFYLVFIAGVVIFAVAPALQGGTWRTALLYGALFGFFAYATYDMTNLATLQGWSPTVTVVDIAWGTFLTGTAAVAGYSVTRTLAGA
ncbi:hypothetical protein AUC70_12410 [Methyloceanibacter stevinii]|uniref:DUF2177 domain-containing protein n=1 Tax=Methyloceanibacter stevinii TaxID=1774970 RepID=A0A1E3VL06_9HYPH|nr:DUF2177 family protein [Methyloceanibacter stevinii]ODR93636.1 hypothetical protein AUC70_12410 [Methyloceanibacter stevinii]